MSGCIRLASAGTGCLRQIRGKVSQDPGSGPSARRARVVRSGLPVTALVHYAVSRGYHSACPARLPRPPCCRIRLYRDQGADYAHPRLTPNLITTNGSHPDDPCTTGTRALPGPGHRFGDQGGAAEVVISSRHAQGHTGRGPGCKAGGRTLHPGPRSGRDEPASRGDHHLGCARGER